MPAEQRRITRSDIISMTQYGKERAERRKALLPTKKLRRVEVGPHATFYFESYDTMLHQVQEMLYIEKGGEAQIDDELRAFAPLIPNGHELVATVMFEIDEPVRRKNFLSQLGGIEETAFLRFAGETVKGVAEADVDRTNAAGKASSVQFIHFPFTTAQIEKFRRPDTETILGFSHPAYGHMSVMPEATRAALAGDLD